MHLRDGDVTGVWVGEISHADGVDQYVDLESSGSGVTGEQCVLGCTSPSECAGPPKGSSARYRVGVAAKGVRRPRARSPG